MGDRSSRGVIAVMGAVIGCGALVGCGGADEPRASERPGTAPSERPADVVVAALESMEDFSTLTYAGTIVTTEESGMRFKDRVTWIVKPGKEQCELTATGQRGRNTWRRVGKSQYVRADAQALRARYGFDVAQSEELAGRWIEFDVDPQWGTGCEFDSLLGVTGGWTVADPGEVTVRGQAGRRYQGKNWSVDKFITLAVEGDPLVLRIEEVAGGRPILTANLVGTNAKAALPRPTDPLDSDDYFEPAE